MALISPSDQDKLREAFTDMTRPVRLVFFTQTLDCEHVRADPADSG